MITLFSAMKNEAPFLLEWISYHRAIGFERIVIYTNDCSDGTKEILDALALEGVVEHHQHVPPSGTSAQANAARLANEARILKDGDWVIWLDADEFLNIHVGDGNVPDLVSLVGGNTGMLIPWRIFGDSNNKTFPGRFISNDFRLAAKKGFGPNREVKTFFRMSTGVVGFAEIGINRPRLNGANDEYRFMNAKGVPIDSFDLRHERWLQGEDFHQTSRIGDKDFFWKVAQINHYLVRTPEYFEMKRARGRGWTANQAGVRNKRHTGEFYVKMNRNDVEDVSILKKERATTDGIRALMKLPLVKLAVERSPMPSPIDKM